MAMSKQNQQLLLLTTVLAAAYFIRTVSASDPTATHNYLNPTSDCEIQNIYEYFVEVMGSFGCSEEASNFFSAIESCGGVKIPLSNISSYKELAEVTNSYSCSEDDDDSEDYSVQQIFSIAKSNLTTRCKPFETCVIDNMTAAINWKLIFIAILGGIGSIAVCILVVALTSRICQSIKRKDYEEIAETTPQAPKEERIEEIDVSDSPAPSMRYKQISLKAKFAKMFISCCGEKPEKTRIKIFTQTGNDFPKYKPESQDIENQQPEATSSQQQAAK